MGKEHFRQREKQGCRKGRAQYDQVYVLTRLSDSQYHQLNTCRKDFAPFPAKACSFSYIPLSAQYHHSPTQLPQPGLEALPLFSPSPSSLLNKPIIKLCELPHLNFSGDLPGPSYHLCYSF